jgi:ribonucleoside-diphosphate reductase alpha chain
MPDPEFGQYIELKYGHTKAEKIFAQLAKGASLETINELTTDEKRTFTTTHQIKPEWHVKIQAAWQKWIDNSVSKTINFGNAATIEDVKKAYMLGWRLGLKGITIYRDGSKLDQVLNVAGKESKLSVSAHQHIATKPGIADKTVCPECGAAAQMKDGCVSCPQCGWSKCSL